MAPQKASEQSASAHVLVPLEAKFGGLTPRRLRGPESFPNASPILQASITSYLTFVRKGTEFKRLPAIRRSFTALGVWQAVSEDSFTAAKPACHHSSGVSRRSLMFFAEQVTEANDVLQRAVGGGLAVNASVEAGELFLMTSFCLLRTDV